VTSGGMHRKPNAPPGWYAHPTMANTQRYWDGDGWTDHVAPTSSHAAPRGSSSGLVTMGYVLAVLFPIGGFVCGLVLISKGKGQTGALVIILSVVLTVVWAYVLWCVGV